MNSAPASAPRGSSRWISSAATRSRGCSWSTSSAASRPSRRCSSTTTAIPYFSYADTIMPSFMFAAGFSYRLSALRAVRQAGAARAYGHFVVRSLALVLISLVMYAAEDLDVKNWSQLESEGIWKARRRALEGKPLGGAGDHRGHPDPDLAGDRREHARPNRRLDRAARPSICRSRSGSTSSSFTASRTGWTTSGPDGQVGLGRRLFRSARLGDPDAVRNDRLRHHGQPYALDGTRRVLLYGAVLMASATPSIAWRPCTTPTRDRCP